jgi:hypothetical protein
VEAKIKVEKFLIKQGIRVGKAAVEFSGDSPLSGFHLVGFTICDDPEKGRYVMFPMAKTDLRKGTQGISSSFVLLLLSCLISFRTQFSTCMLRFARKSIGTLRDSSRLK